MGSYSGSGGLRKGSFSWALLGAAAELVPEGVALDVYDRLKLGRFPQFDQDLQESPPEVGRGLRRGFGLPARY